MKIELHGMVKKATGEWDGLVFKKVYGKIVAVTKPTTSGEPTENQLAQREHFKQAVMYAKSALLDPQLRPLYAAAAFAKDTPIFGLIVADYLNPPTIISVDASDYNGQAGGTIKVIASDDFGVASVKIGIFDADADEETNFESGQAVESPAGSGYWYYTATTNAPAGILAGIQVTAADRPGGETIQRGTKQI